MDWFCCACTSKLFFAHMFSFVEALLLGCTLAPGQKLQEFAFHGITASGIGQSMHYTMVSLPIVDDKKQGF